MTTNEKIAILKRRLEEETAYANELADNLESSNNCRPNGYDRTYEKLYTAARTIQKIRADFETLERGSEQ